jgi:hypothetical protein
MINFSHSFKRIFKRAFGRAAKMKKIPLSQSYFPQDTKVSVYQVVFPVFKIDENVKPIELLGSCCAISNGGLYLSAAHLFQPFVDYKNEQQKPNVLRKLLRYKKDELRVGIGKFYGEGSQTRFKILPVHNLNIFTDHDIAIFMVQEEQMPPPDGPRLAILENLKLKQSLKIIGYPGTANSFAKGENNSKSTFHAALDESEGRILAFYPNGRDRGHAWFPCIETDAKMNAGHSGGAAIDFSVPALVGINSISGNDDLSLVSWIAKILDEEFGMEGLLLTTNDGAQIKLESITLRQLSRMGLIKII